MKSVLWLGAWREGHQSLHLTYWRTCEKSDTAISLTMPVLLTMLIFPYISFPVQEML